jgi:hypothetical protein
MSEQSIVPKVFISYSHDSEEHSKWVEKLYADLRDNGIDAIIDKYDASLGENLAAFMEVGLTKSHRVLCVCSKEYVIKADGFNSGVGYEKMILTGSLMQQANSTYIIPIIRNNDGDKKVPLFLTGKRYVDFCIDSHYSTRLAELVTAIHNKMDSLRPPLGQNPFEQNLAVQVALKNTFESSLFINSTLEDRVKFEYLRNSGNYRIGSGEYLFNTHWSKSGIGRIYAYRDGVKAIAPLKESDFPLEIDIDNYDFTSRVWTIEQGSSFVLINHYGKAAVIKVILVNLSEVVFQYKIYYP